MTRMRNSSLDYYNKNVIQRIMEIWHGSNGGRKDIPDIGNTQHAGKRGPGDVGILGESDFRHVGIGKGHRRSPQFGISKE